MKHLLFFVLNVSISLSAFSQLPDSQPSYLKHWKECHNGEVESMAICLFQVTTDSGKQDKKFIWRLSDLYNKQGYITEMYNNCIPSDTANNSMRCLIEYLGFKRSKAIEYRKSKGKQFENGYSYTYETLGHGISVGTEPIPADTNVVYFQVKYDSAGNLIEENMLRNGSVITNTKNKYDNRGNCIEVREVSHKIRHPAELLESDKWAYVYNEKGLCTEEDFYNTAGDSIVAKNLYTYDNRNDAVREIEIRNTKNDTITVSYSNYDKYGNWLTYEETDANDTTHYTLIERTIDYY